MKTGSSPILHFSSGILHFTSPVMFTLPLIAPDVSEILAVHYLDRGAPSAQYRAVEWTGAWHHASSGNGDILAWGLVVCFLLTLGVVAGCVLSLRSRPVALTPEQELIEEVQQNEDALALGGTPAAAEGESWERDPEWWRKDGG